MVGPSCREDRSTLNSFSSRLGRRFLISPPGLRLCWRFSVVGDLRWGLRNDHFSSTHRYNVGGYVYGASQVRIQFDKYNWSNARWSCLRSSGLRGGFVVYCGLTVFHSGRSGNLLCRFLDHRSKIGTFFLAKSMPSCRRGYCERSYMQASHSNIPEQTRRWRHGRRTLQLHYA